MRIGKMCDPLLAELKYLVSKRQPWRRNSLRTNLAHSKDDIVVDGTWRKLKVGVFSNGVREGQSPVSDRMLVIVREMLPHATVNALQLNRNVVCGRHKDARQDASQKPYPILHTIAAVLWCSRRASV